MTPPMFFNYFETGICSCPQTLPRARCCGSRSCSGLGLNKRILFAEVSYLVLRFLLSLELEDEMRDKIDKRDKEVTFEPIFLRTRSCQYHGGTVNKHWLLSLWAIFSIFRRVTCIMKTNNCFPS